MKAGTACASKPARRGAISARLFATAVVALYMLVGAPVWWYLIRVYRADLPDPGLIDLKFEPPLSTTIVRVHATFDLDVNELQQKLQLGSASGAQYQLAILGTTDADAVRAVVTSGTALEIDRSLGAFISKAEPGAAHAAREGSIALYMVQDTSLSDGDSCLPQFTMGRERHGWLIVPPCKDKGSLLHGLATILNRFTTLLAPPPRGKGITLLKPSTQYQLVLSLLVEDSQAQHVTWDMETAAATMLQPFLEAISPIANFTIDTQIRHIAPAGQEPTWSEALKAYTVKDTGLFLNEEVWYLGGGISALLPTLHLLVFVPAPSHRPLKVRNSDSNTFAVEQWGGVYIANPSDSSSQSVHLGTAELQPACESFVGLIKRALGFKNVVSSQTSGISALFDEHTALAAWELDLVVKRRLAEALWTSRDKLNSTSNLAESLPSIVISDDVSEKATESLALAQQSTAMIREGRLWDALKQANIALTLSTAAFQHDTMVGLLYFPDEYKAAVYIPLLLPMVVPVVSNLVKLFNAYRVENAV